MKFTRRQGGFTLVEIAIVLVIIGLLLGGVLKGQELIELAKIKRFVGIWDAHKAAIYGFQDKFRALPGDMSNAYTEIPGVAATHVGNGDGVIAFSDPRTAGAGNEGQLVWEHLGKAGFMSSVVDPAAAALEQRVLPNGWGGYFTDVHHSTGGLYLYTHQAYAPVGTMKVKHIKQIDIQYDDGFPGSGNVVEHYYGRTGSGYNPADPGTWNATVGGAQMEDNLAYTWYRLQ